MRGGSQFQLCFVIVDSVTGIGYNNEYSLTLVWVSVCRRRKDHSYVPLCKYYNLFTLITISIVFVVMAEAHFPAHYPVVNCWMTSR